MENHLAPPSEELAVTPAPASAGDMALFIDWENVKISLTNKHLEPNISALLDGLESSPDIPNGRLVIARAYADWSTYYMNRDQISLYESGVEPVFVPSIRRSGENRKNSVDVKIAVDCMEVSYSNDSINTYILVSGDADYLHIANSLRSRGKRVLMVGVHGATSSRITTQRVDDLFFCEELMGTSLDGQGAFTESPVRTVQEYMDLVVEIIQEEKAQMNYPVLLSYLGDRMRRRAPGISYVNFGYPKMKALLTTMQANGRLRIAAADLADWAYLPGDENITPQRFSDEADQGAFPHADTLLTDHSEVAADVVCTLREMLDADRLPVFSALKAHLRKKANDVDTNLPDPRPASSQLIGMRPPQIDAVISAALAVGLLEQSVCETPDGQRKLLSLNESHSFVVQTLADRDSGGSRDGDMMCPSPQIPQEGDAS